ncbi:hypothetical protein HMI01_29450 [Halolactibacillus miurensis]|uniref:Uncharacterized protein n=2 Tax=Halolactibacillus miurensis TaxID=306541 RepID=A0ABQ0VXS3_9BACI|nr:MULTISPECIES: DUF6710 family protein [Halolactibacillus]GEM05957.1 hypothetical protein HMI01_29450 [Halolactibacillus miurensis]
MKREKAENRIKDVIYSLGRVHQFELINNIIKKTGYQINSNNSIMDLFFDTNKCNYYFHKLSDSGYEIVNIQDRRDDNSFISPSETLVFSFPWNKQRMIDAFKEIGEAVGNKWEHQPINHKVCLIKPLNIAVIENGYHSSSINIITNESPFKVTSCLDLTPIYNEIFTDGVYFFDKKSSTKLAPVRSVEMAAIFEIGRIILDDSEKALDIDS